MKNHYSIKLIAEILAFSKINKSFKEISKITGVTRSSVSRIIINYKETKTTQRSPHSGRNKALKFNEVEFIINKIKKCPKISSPGIAKQLELETGKVVTGRTIQNYMNKNCYHSKIACKKNISV